MTISRDVLNVDSPVLRILNSRCLRLLNNHSVRYLAIDLGDKRTGLALGDSQTRLALPAEVLEVPLAQAGGETLLAAIVAAIDRLVGASAACELVVGVPLIEGEETPRSKLVRAFAGRLASRAGRKVHFQDEALTSTAADWSMARSGLTHKQKKERRDALAAAEFLGDFLTQLP